MRAALLTRGQQFLARCNCRTQARLAACEPLRVLHNHSAGGIEHQQQLQQQQHRRADRFVQELPSIAPQRAAQQHQQHLHLHTVVTPAIAHHQLTRTPLQAPIVQPSHTAISIPLGLIDLYGNYSVQGPAVIRKVANALVAVVQPGGAVSMLSNPTDGPVVMSSSSLSHDEDEAAVVALMGAHLELDGCFILSDEQEGLRHDGKTIVSVAQLSEDNTITLLPGGSCSHPVNCHPH